MTSLRVTLAELMTALREQRRRARARRNAWTVDSRTLADIGTTRLAVQFAAAR